MFEERDDLARETWPHFRGRDALTLKEEANPTHLAEIPSMTEPSLPEETIFAQALEFTTAGGA
jgi:hypothetical protein